ncbi:MAG TPA: methyltransferase, partial [Spongiibacteraceae bacterium]|nr:methyltransferase [Spongiibacteraceae bacterium]
DESYQAIAAVQTNYAANGLSEIRPSAAFHVDDVFTHYSGESFDLILCNPPFHQGHVVGDHIARQMCAQSKKHLCRGGEFWLVGNRHLDYHIALKKIFGNCRQIAANAKFVILAARVS